MIVVVKKIVAVEKVATVKKVAIAMYSNFDEISEKILTALKAEEFIKISDRFAEEDILFFKKLLNNNIDLAIEDLFFDPFNNSTFYVRFKNIPYTIEVIKSTFNFYVYVAI